MTIFSIPKKMFLKIESLMCALKPHVNRIFFFFSHATGSHTLGPHTSHQIKEADWLIDGRSTWRFFGGKLSPRFWKLKPQGACWPLGDVTFCQCNNNNNTFLEAFDYLVCSGSLFIYQIKKKKGSLFNMDPTKDQRSKAYYNLLLPQGVESLMKLI